MVGAYDASSAVMTPTDIGVAFVQAGVAKTKPHPLVVFGKAFNAGMMLSFGCTIYLIAMGGSPGLTASNPGLVKVLASALFPVGLITIVLNGQDLITANMMSLPMAWMCGRIRWWMTPWNWLIVTLGNLVGSLFYDAILVKYSGILSAPTYHEYVVHFADVKMITPEWHQIFLRAIGCNVLVCIAVWQATSARDVISKVVAIWIPVFVFVCLSFDHVVANMCFIPLAMMFGSPDVTVGFYLGKSFIPAFLGNAVGALLIGVPFKFYYLNGPRLFQDVDASAIADEVEKGERTAVSSGVHTPSDASQDFIKRHMAHFHKTQRREWRTDKSDPMDSPTKEV